MPRQSIPTPQKTWKLRDPSPAPPGLAAWADELGISEFLAGLLHGRGLDTLAALDAYLSPGLRHLVDPGTIPGLEDAARVLCGLLSQGKRVAIWGDYDVDGVTSTALLLEFLRAKGFDPLWHLPQRLEEGYGLNLQGLKDLAQAGAQVLLTVDCGITNPVEAAYAAELGLEVIITDHHLPKGELPKARAICNPRLAENPAANLAGVGVAFFLAARLNRLLPGEPLDVRQFLDLVALGTLADVVSLSGVNRVLVKNGLLLLAKADRPGVAALKEAAQFAPDAVLGAGQVSFGLAPRINAAGRMGEPGAALELLLCRDLPKARELAEKLDKENTKRRAAEADILLEALDQASLIQESQGLVVFAPHWHSGVIGIVASRLVEAMYRPALILTQEDGKLKGSGRSIPEFDLFAGLSRCEDLLLGFGGHKQAAGLSLAPEMLPQLRERFAEICRQDLGENPLSPRLKIECELDFSRIDFTLLKEIELMQPFGCGNPEPVFVTPQVVVKNRRDMKRIHAILDLQDPTQGLGLRAKLWRRAEELPQNLAGRKLRFAFTPRLDTYSGLPSVELNIKDWRE